MQWWASQNRQLKVRPGQRKELFNLVSTFFCNFLSPAFYFQFQFSISSIKTKNAVVGFTEEAIKKYGLQEEGRRNRPGVGSKHLTVMRPEADSQQSEYQLKSSPYLISRTKYSTLLSCGLWIIQGNYMISY